MSIGDEPKRQMPKGGRKGGAVFPRIPLKDAVAYARKLVSKTHVNPQPRDVILSGVVGAKSGKGNIRISALKQFGFLKGDNKSRYSADELAKKIDSAPDEELVNLYRKSALRPNIFRSLFETFQGDIVTKAKLKQRAADLKVHPDETETCVDVYVSSLSMAELVTADADRITHMKPSQLLAANAMPKEQEEAEQDGIEEASNDLEGEAGTSREKEGETELDGTKEFTPSEASQPPKGGPRAVFNVNVTLDSSLDIEKLQKQLELLKRFGAI